MFHKHKEGNKVEPGFSLMVADDDHLYGVAFNLFQKLIGVFDWGYKRIWISLNLQRFHRMYRPNDVDGPEMVCERCGLWNGSAPNVCGGKLFTWRKSWPRVTEEKTCHTT